MNFIKVPVAVFLADLPHASLRVYLHLLLHHFRYCRNDYEKTFYLTDRDLANLSSCSSRTVWLTKNRLKKAGLIDFQTGLKNRTYYKIFSGNGHIQPK